MERHAFARGDVRGEPNITPAPDVRRLECHELVAVVQELSYARTMEDVVTVVRRSARALTGADGAAIVLREGDECVYVDEDAVAPLFKGRRFPVGVCICGWAMEHAERVAIEDISADPRIPQAAYEGTFVRSLLTIPIRRNAPIGALAVYWAEPRRPTEEEASILQALADSTSIALENLRLYEELENRVKERTAQLEAANRELEAFAYSVSHDLRAPLRAVQGFALAVVEDAGEGLDATCRGHLDRVVQAASRMNGLIESLLELSRLHKGAVERVTINVNAMAREVVRELRQREPGRQVDLVVAERLSVDADPRLYRILLDNVLGNAWKFTGRTERARIEVFEEGGDVVVRDNGVGFDMSRVDRLFAPFQRLHTPDEFPGTGIGLAIVGRIVRRHDGAVSIAGAPGEGTTVRVRV